MVTEGMYVIIVEQALFLVGAAGALLMHCEQACVRMDADLECLENGPLYFSVLYGVSLLASMGAFVGLVGSVVMTALVPGSFSFSIPFSRFCLLRALVELPRARQRQVKLNDTKIKYTGRHSASVEGMGLACLHWQIAVAATLVWTVLVVWQQPGNERRALFAVLLRTGVGRAENEYLTKLYSVCVFVLLGFLIVFSFALFSGVARAGGRNASLRLYSLAVSCLLLSVFVQRWLSAYRRRVCDNVGSEACMPPLTSFRAAWFEPEYDTLWESLIVLAVLLASDVVGAKARSLYMRRPYLKPLCLSLFVVSRSAVGTGLGLLVLWQLEYDIAVFWWSNFALWTAVLLFSAVDVLAFIFADSEMAEPERPMVTSVRWPAPTAPVLQLSAPLSTPAFDATGRVFLKHKTLRRMKDA